MGMVIAKHFDWRTLPLWLAVGASTVLLCLGQFRLVEGWQSIMFLNVGGVGLIACLALSELRRRHGELEILKLREVATTDPLTGVGNRRLFEQELSRRLAIHRRYKTPCSMLLIDADHFKSINDTWGHDKGDQILKGLAKAISVTLRDIDFLYRIGGEEFVALLPETEADKARIAGERIRSAVSELSVPVEGGRLGVTVSLGGAQLLGSDNADSWLKRADEALYAAKRNGRDCVVISLEGSANFPGKSRPKYLPSGAR